MYIYSYKEGKKHLFRAFFFFFIQVRRLSAIYVSPNNHASLGNGLCKGFMTALPKTDV